MDDSAFPLPFSLDGHAPGNHDQPVLLFDQQGRILFANASAVDLFGYSAEEFSFLRIFEISPEVNQENWLSFFSLSESLPIYFRLKNWHLVRALVRPVAMDEGEDARVVFWWESFTRDLEDGERLREFHHDLGSPEKLARMSHFTIQRANDGIFWINSAGEITHVNEAACRRLGYTRGELTSMLIFDVNLNYDPSRLGAAFETLRAQGTMLSESSHTTRDGREIPVEISSNYIYFEGEEYTCSIVRDISERKRKEAALRGAFHEIQELRERLEAENNYLQEEIKVSNDFGEIISQNRSMQQLFREVEQVATTQATVLILGESGTGKELIARSLHHLSPRSDRPMIKVNCAALPAYLIESELFGHEKGAFTGALQRRAGRFELAHQSTIFLDEIGEMPLELQSKLLRVLQEGEFERLGGGETIRVDVRIIAATNRKLEKEVEKGKFREDLYYRLNVFPISCPPLRDRLDDIPILVRHFCQKMEPRIGKKIEYIPQKVLDQLQAYHFPGNIRELENIIERAVILSRNGKLQLGNWLPQPPKRQVDPENLPTLEEVNRQHIVEVLKLTRWRVSGDGGAAAILGLKPTTLESRMKKLGIRRSNEAQ